MHRLQDWNGKDTTASGWEAFTEISFSNSLLISQARFGHNIVDSAPTGPRTDY
jgi:hypothetical protein